jgi:hypothetical protein
MRPVRSRSRRFNGAVQISGQRQAKVTANSTELVTMEDRMGQSPTAVILVGLIIGMPIVAMALRALRNR